MLFFNLGCRPPYNWRSIFETFDGHFLNFGRDFEKMMYFRTYDGNFEDWTETCQQMRRDSERFSLNCLDSLYFLRFYGFENQNKQCGLKVFTPDDHMKVLQDNLHQDGRVELDIATDQMLERDDPALPVVVALRHDALPAPQLDKEVGDVGERDAERCCVPNGRLVVAVFSEGRDEVLPLLDGGVDITSLLLACPALRVLSRPSSGAGCGGGITKTSAGAEG